MRRFIHVCILMCLSVMSAYAQNIRVRSSEVSANHEVLEKYDTTTAYLQIKNLKRNIHYYDDQIIMYLPDINQDRPYSYYEGFHTKNPIALTAYADTLWNKRKTKILSVNVPHSDVYKASLMNAQSEGYARKLDFPWDRCVTNDGFYTPAEFVEGIRFLIKCVSQLSDYIFEFELVDAVGNSVFHQIEYITNDDVPPILMCAYYDNIYNRYFEEKIKIFSVNKIEKSLQTNKLHVLYGDYTCVDVALMEGEKSHAMIDIPNVSYPYYIKYLYPHLILRDSNGEEFAISTELGRWQKTEYTLKTSEVVGLKNDRDWCDWIRIEDLELATDYYARVQKAKEIQLENERLEEEKRTRDEELKRKLEAERRKLAEIEKAKKEREQKERYDNLVIKYGQSIADYIIKGQVRIGMTKSMCREAWGNPYDINRTTNAYGTREQWVYGIGRYLYFEGDILTTIQD